MTYLEHFKNTKEEGIDIVFYTKDSENNTENLNNCFKIIKKDSGKEDNLIVNKIKKKFLIIFFVIIILI